MKNYKFNNKYNMGQNLTKIKKVKIKNFNNKI